MASPANPIGQASFSTTAYSYTPLVSDGDDIVSRSGTVASGIGILRRGAILKIDPTTSAITAPVAATDCNCILVNDIDATSATVPATVYVGGKFKADAVIWPGALSHSAVSDNLRNFDIQIESVIYVDGTLVKSAPTQEEQKNAEAVVAANVAAASTTTTTTTPAPGQTAAGPSDSPWAYLTGDQKASDPQLAEAPTTTTAAPTTAGASGSAAGPGGGLFGGAATTTPAPATS
jgi:hypothetical protein